MQLRYKKLHPDASPPQKAYERDAGFDLCACERTVISAQGRSSVPTGLAIELPEGTVGLVWDKSSLAKKQGLTVLAGVIDEGYRGEIVLCIANLGQQECVIEKGQKAAQLIVQKVEHPILEEVEELTDSHRGERGWGSSGS